jgi:putative phage-type endonuclease
MKIVDCKQGTSAWFQARCGRVTASEIVNVLSFLKGGLPSAKRSAYQAQIVAEILTGAPDMDGYVSPYMQRGTEMEPAARRAYVAHVETMVDQVGFVVHPTIDRAGASPDGLVGDDGCVEIKCPKTENHLSYMLAGVVPEQYEPQMMWEMACTERQWCDFVSYDPRPGRRHALFVKRLARNDERIAEITNNVLKFLAEADAIVERLNEINPPVEEPEDICEPVDPELYITDADLPDWARTPKESDAK